MAVRIRLRAQGSVNRVSYRVVVADSRSPRDGKYIESVGWYDPLMKDRERQVHLMPDRIQYWMSEGAEITEKVESLLKRAAPGVLQAYRAKQLEQVAKAAEKRKQKKKA